MKKITKLTSEQELRSVHGTGAQGRGLMPHAPALHLVEPEPQPEPPVNVSDLVRADIMARDWSRAHVWADKQPAVALHDARKWGWFR